MERVEGGEGEERRGVDETDKVVRERREVDDAGRMARFLRSPRRSQSRGVAGLISLGAKRAVHSSSQLTLAVFSSSGTSSIVNAQ